MSNSSNHAQSLQPRKIKPTIGLTSRRFIHQISKNKIFNKTFYLIFPEDSYLTVEPIIKDTVVITVIRSDICFLFYKIAYQYLHCNIILFQGERRIHPLDLVDFLEDKSEITVVLGINTDLDFDNSSTTNE